MTSYKIDQPGTPMVPNYLPEIDFNSPMYKTKKQLLEWADIYPIKKTGTKDQIRERLKQYIENYNERKRLQYEEKKLDKSKKPMNEVYDSYSKRSYNELRQIAKYYNIKSSGTKQDILQRVIEFPFIDESKARDLFGSSKEKELKAWEDRLIAWEKRLKEREDKLNMIESGKSMPKPSTPTPKISLITTPIKTLQTPREIETMTDDIDMQIELLNQLGEKYPKLDWPTDDSFVSLVFTSVIDKYNHPFIDDILYSGFLESEVVMGTNGLSLVYYPEVSKDYDSFPIDFQYLGEQLKNLQDKDLVCIPVYITIVDKVDKSGKPMVTERHLNLLIYRPKMGGVVDHFEPHGSSYYSKYDYYDEANKYINDGMKKLWETQLTPYIGKVKYVSRDVVCSTRVGIQVLSEGRLCALITIFIADLCLKNPKVNTPEIVKKVLELSNSESDYIKRIMNGYIVTAYKDLKTYVKEIYISLSKNQQWAFDQLKKQIAEPSTPKPSSPKPSTPKPSSPKPSTPQPKPQIKDPLIKKIVDDFREPDMIVAFQKAFPKQYTTIEKKVLSYRRKEKPTPIGVIADLYGSQFIHFLEQFFPPNTILQGIINSIVYLEGYTDQEEEDRGPSVIKSYFTKKYVEENKEDFM